MLSCGARVGSSVSFRCLGSQTSAGGIVRSAGRSLLRRGPYPYSQTQLQRQSQHSYLRHLAIVCASSSNGDSSSNGGSRDEPPQPAEADSLGPVSAASARPELEEVSDYEDGMAGQIPDDEATHSYREILGEWFSGRETDLRSLAAEGRTQLQDFLAEPQFKVFGRDVDLSRFTSIGRDFDLSSFKGSFSRVTAFTAWYSSNDEEAEKEPVEEQAGKVGVQSVDGEHPAAAAFRSGRHANIGFGFSAGGLLFSYFLGVVFELRDLGIMNDETKVAGASAGSLIAACFHSGLSEEVLKEACFELAADCRENGTRGRLGVVLRKFLEELLPEDIHERCRGKVYVAVTRVFPTPTPLLVTDFESREDLISALLTSCHIPWWFDKRVWTSFRGSAAYDGGLTQFIPLPPVEYGVRVCCFAAKQITSVYDIQISPDSFAEWRHSMQQMVSWAFEPGPIETLEELEAKGRADARAWAEATGVLDLVSGDGADDGQQKEKLETAAAAA